MRFEGKLMDGYMTSRQIAEKWKMTPRRVQVLCAEGKIKGASKLGREWAVPADAVKPTDNRVTTGRYRNWRNSTKDKRDL